MLMLLRLDKDQDLYTSGIGKNKHVAKTYCTPSFRVETN